MSKLVPEASSSNAPDATPYAPRAYDKMGDVLAHLTDTWRARPKLAEAAQKAGLSPSHFQRLFTAWAGVSPRQFMEAIGHATAGEALRDGASVLDAAFEGGFSGPGRLHDCFVAHEGLSPGEAKTSDVTLKAGVAQTPFGLGAFVTSNRGLVALGFSDTDGEDAVADLVARYPNAEVRRDDGEAARWAGRVFEPNAPIPLCLYGTPWRRQVWRALLEIPPGATTSYGALAGKIGDPKAARATGAAVGANPISWLIPCHRVLASNGKLNGYHWGLPRKRAMLVYEHAHSHMAEAS